MVPLKEDFHRQHVSYICIYSWFSQFNLMYFTEINHNHTLSLQQRQMSYKMI